jgi:5-methylcytosine-specific restriction endonuclease McrA
VTQHSDRLRQLTAIPKPTPVLKEPKRLAVKYRGIPQPVKQAVFARDDLTCQWCKVPGGTLDAHHRLPRSAGGSDQGRFLVSVHRLCHRYIHENPEEARRRRFLVRSEGDLAEGWT